MRIRDTSVDGAKLIELERRQDDRGYFARVWCRDTFAAHGLTADFAQCNTSFSATRGTLRGLHYQAAPHAEVKLVRCIRGRVFDVVVDLRPASPTYRRWFGAELSEDNGLLLYVPGECAHGYLTLEDDTEVMYPVSTAYHPAAERGIRWDDPRFAIAWPIDGPFILSDKDRQWPDYR